MKVKDIKVNVQNNFEDYSLKDWRDNTDCILHKDMTFFEAVEEIEKKEVSYFYISMSADDVIDAMQNEEDMADMLGLHLIYIVNLGIYIATY